MKENSELKESAKDFFWGFVKDDYTQLGYLTAYILDRATELSTSEIVCLTKEIIQELIEEKNIYVVSIKTECRMEMPIEEIFDEIDIVFSETYGMPRVGDGIWFSVDE